MKHVCATCPADVTRSRLMCAECWAKVPVLLRHGVNAGWREYSTAVREHRARKASSDAVLAARTHYFHVRRKAIDAVQGKSTEGQG